MNNDTNRPEKYYAVIFTSTKSGLDGEYSLMAERMEELAAAQPGYIGIESARNPDGMGITVSYWESLEAIREWKKNSEHLTAQKKGREKWYSNYHVRICEVVHEYTFQGI